MKILRDFSFLVPFPFGGRKLSQWLRRWAEHTSYKGGMGKFLFHLVAWRTGLGAPPPKKRVGARELLLPEGGGGPGKASLPIFFVLCKVDLFPKGVRGYPSLRRRPKAPWASHPPSERSSPASTFIAQPAVQAIRV